MRGTKFSYVTFGRPYDVQQRTLQLSYNCQLLNRGIWRETSVLNKYDLRFSLR
jgi:hypothetical protein